MPNVFPFYDAEPYWPKRDVGSGGDGGDQGGGGGATLGAGYQIVVQDALARFTVWASDQPMNNLTDAKFKAENTEGIGTSYCVMPAGLYVFVAAGIDGTIESVTGVEYTEHEEGFVSFQMPTNEVELTISSGGGDNY